MTTILPSVSLRLVDVSLVIPENKNKTTEYDGGEFLCREEEAMPTIQVHE